jgi:hypothetical protein
MVSDISACSFQASNYVTTVLGIENNKFKPTQQINVSKTPNSHSNPPNMHSLLN